MSRCRSRRSSAIRSPTSSAPRAGRIRAFRRRGTSSAPERPNSAGINLPDRRGTAAALGRLPRGAREAAPCTRRSSAGRSGMASGATAVRLRSSIASSARRPTPTSRSRRSASTSRRPRNPSGTASPAAVRAQMLRDAADRLERDSARLHRHCASRRRARPCPTRSPKCAKPSTSCATTRRAREADFGRAAAAARADRRVEPPGAARPRRLRLHQPLELSARDLHRPGDRRARRGQCRDRKAGRADAAGRRARWCGLLHASGIPGDVLHLLPGRGSRIGPVLTAIRASQASPSPVRRKRRGSSTARSPRTTARSPR